MAQTLSREELASELDSAYSKLDVLLDGVAEADLFDAIAVDGWTVHDILAVRVWWAEAVSEWIAAGLRDENPQTPAPGFNWTQTRALNQSVVDASTDVPILVLRDRLEAAVALLRRYIETLDDDQLLSVGVFSWTRTWPVSRWIAVNTITQYASLSKMVRRLLKSANQL
ncbi:ClbS/DfsB family four-helix bundle protein [Rhodococcus sp. IEGM 1409]|uniref:ClbS/DfsB family four-helix bundle protein n=1 Tax=Rhodococcus sp. IEGM 1409 TaxID=3047082 RepID=UPI0024B65EB8|nr:ClbS/DfsB family four-helix bundle protein [Rhodococcus sp. IEGM 1409]MDI9899303.1 ClbS/DfsB family four-helix bundle protein [Rhodococcus sp. IEGM 1409]